MSEEPGRNSGFRKKYLYMDKFTDHVKEDQVWKKNISTWKKGVEIRVKLVVIFTAVSFIITLAVAIFK